MKKDKDKKVIISKRINETMTLCGMKQVELAEKTGISKGALSSYLSGKYAPKHNNLVLIANALGVSLLWLMGEDSETEVSGITSPSETDTQDAIKAIDYLINKIPDEVLKRLALLCRNRRIENEMTEKYVASQIELCLSEYLEFEINARNIGAEKIVSLLKLLEFELSFITGWLSGLSQFKLPRDEYFNSIDKFFPEPDANKIAKLLIDLTPDELQRVLKHLEKSFSGRVIATRDEMRKELEAVEEEMLNTINKKG